MVVATIPVGDAPIGVAVAPDARSEEHTSELQSRSDLVCRLLLEKKKPEHVSAQRCDLSADGHVRAGLTQPVSRASPLVLVAPLVIGGASHSWVDPTSQPLRLRQP